MKKETSVKSLYNLLNPNEKKDFSLWLHYQWTNKSQDVVNLCKQLGSPLSKEEIWKNIYGEKEYNDLALRRLYNRLKDQLKIYLTNKNFFSHTLEREIVLIKSLSERSIQPEVFDAEFRKAMKRLESQPLRNGRYFRTIYEMEKLHQNYLINYTPKKYKRREQAIEDAMDIWILHEKLLAGLMSLNTKSVHNQNITTRLVKESLLLLKNQPYFVEKAPLLFIYQKLYLFSEGENKDSLGIWKFVQKHRARMDLDELKNVLFILLNYQMRKANRNGQIEDYEHLFVFYEAALKEELLFVDGQLPSAHYKNFINASLVLAKANTGISFEKVYDYIQNLKLLLPPEEVNEVYQIALGSYYYHIGEWNKAKDLLREKFKIPTHEIQARIYMIKLLYEEELSKDGHIEFALRNVKEYVRRQNIISPNSKQNYLNRLNLIQKLITTNKPQKLVMLLEQVKNSPVLNDRVWLIEKIREKMNV